MAALILRPIRQLAQALVANDSPRQIAWGFVLGLFVGLLPKDNLLAVVLGMLLFALRTNTSAGLLSAGLFSFVGLLFDGLAHRLGAIALVWESARPAFAWLYELPLGPWLGTNNTVVVGQLLIGLYLAYPAYWFAHEFSSRIQPRLGRWLFRYRVIRWLRGVEVGAQWGADT